MVCDVSLSRARLAALLSIEDSSYVARLIREYRCVSALYPRDFEAMEKGCGDVAGNVSTITASWIRACLLIDQGEEARVAQAAINRRCKRCVRFLRLRRLNTGIVGLHDTVGLEATGEGNLGLLADTDPLTQQ